MFEQLCATHGVVVHSLQQDILEGNDLVDSSASIRYAFVILISSRSASHENELINESALLCFLCTHVGAGDHPALLAAHACGRGVHGHFLLLLLWGHNLAALQEQAHTSIALSRTLQTRFVDGADVWKVRFSSPGNSGLGYVCDAR